MEQCLKDAYALSDTDGNEINTGKHCFKVSQQAGKQTLNRERLRLELLEALGDDHAAEKLISWCEDEGKPFEQLPINKIS